MCENKNPIPIYRNIHSCLNTTHYLPGRRPLECELNKERRDTYNVKCCNTDYCNNDSTVRLYPSGEGGITFVFCFAFYFSYIQNRKDQ